MPARLLPKPLSTFEPLENGILFHEPPHRNPALPTKAPSLIIIATWFAALPHQIAKYTTAYQTLYPEASLLILQSSIPDLLYRPYSTQQRSLLPCVPIILKCIQTQKREILLHLFSNSGAHTACQLAHSYRSQTGTALQLGAMVADSAPARGTFRTMSRGFTAGLPSTIILNQLLSLVSYGLVGATFLKETVHGQDNFVEKSRSNLNDSALVTSRRGRVYIYSREDQIVNWVDVESHARDAAEKLGAGEAVSLERWSGSGHVAHRGKDSKRYWEVITQLWGDIDGKEMMVKARL